MVKTQTKKQLLEMIEKLHGDIEIRENLIISVNDIIVKSEIDIEGLNKIISEHNQIIVNLTASRNNHIAKNKELENINSHLNYIINSLNILISELGNNDLGSN